jgi:glycosyltransferase involved in cell wall biosynthesis
MSEKTLHIIAFDIPYPPNYGGVIDVFYKLKALHRMGLRIILHCFEYPGRDRSDELNRYCSEVHYYPRLLGLRSAFSLKPYIVSSRRSGKLLKNLMKDDHPILFEGLHSCYYLNHPALKNRIKIYRESNIEHHYYYNLFKVDRSLRKKLYYLVASVKLRLYQNILKHASLMLVVSEKDTEYLEKHFPGNEVAYLPSFHANDAVESLPGKGAYALYNGNIEVPENAHAVEFLIKEVFNNLEIPLIIAGMNPPQRIVRLAATCPHVEIVANPYDKKMFELIKDAHVNILVTFQATGLKLKLLNTIYNGRFCLVNNPMLNGTGLADLCEIGNSAGELKENLIRLFDQNFEESEILKREKVLEDRYSNQKNGERLMRLVFGKD